MIAPIRFYPTDPHFITVVLDTDDVRQSEHLRALEESFGKGCSIRERLDRRICCLHILPGGTSKNQRIKATLDTSYERQRGC